MNIGYVFNKAAKVAKFCQFWSQWSPIICLFHSTYFYRKKLHR